MIDIRQLRYFITVAEKLHFGLAAQSLNITQPPLSRQIAALEEALGVELLKRNSRQVYLTPAGEQFLKDSKLVVSTFEQACHNAQLAQNGRLGSIGIGFMMHAAFSSVPPLVKQFTQTYPEVNLQLQETLPASLISNMLNGHYDAVITFNPGQIKHVSSMSLHTEPMCLAIPVGHWLDTHTLISPDLLQEETMIATPANVAPALYDAIQGYFHRAGFAAPAVKIETQLQQTILGLVAEGLGVALVPESLRNLAMKGVAFCTLDNAPLVEHVIAWRSDNTNPVLPLFVDIASNIHR